MIDFLVFAALAAAAVFVAAWLVSPKLRRWIEEPKYAFQRRLEKSDGRDPK
jgi:hypothetical protein